MPESSGWGTFYFGDLESFTTDGNKARAPRGLEWVCPFGFFDGLLHPIAAVDVQSEEENEWDLDLSAKTGPSPTGFNSPLSTTKATLPMASSTMRWWNTLVLGCTTTVDTMG